MFGDQVNYIALASLSGLDNSEEAGYKSGICDNDRLQMYCHNTLYGPLTDTADSHSFFYISVGNPSILEATNSEIYDSRSDQIGYAFALFPQNSDIINFHHEDCGSILINLGTVLHSIQTLSNESLVLNYSEGSICDLKSKKPYSSSLQLICDKSELDGWPFLYRQRDECHYEFQ